MLAAMLNQFTRRRIWLVVLVTIVVMLLVCALAMTPLAESVINVLLVFSAIGIDVLGILFIFIATFFVILFLALIEGSHLALRFKVKLWRTLMILVLPNFVMIMLVVVAMFISWETLAIAFVLTYVVKLPFYYWALGKREKRLRQSLLAPVLINAVPFVIGMYLAMASSPTKVSAEELAAGRPEVLYFIDAKSRRIVQSDLTGKSLKTVGDVASNENERLHAALRNDKWYLYLGSESVCEIDASIPEALIGWNGEPDEFSPRCCGDVLQLPAAENSEWECYNRSHDGIDCINTVTGKKYSLSWLGVSDASQIGGDLLVFEGGKDKIYLLHIPSKRLALIARGYGPLVVEPKVTEF